MHEGIVSTIKATEPIKGADRIVRADIAVNDVIIASVVTGTDTPIGAKGIYFGSDIQLSEEYSAANNLLVKRDENGNRIEGSGYLDEKRRIKAQRFKGVRSEGLWMPLESLAYTGLTGVADGSLITKIGDHEICKRYPKPEPTFNSAQGITKRTTLEYFPEHIDTPQLIHCLRDVEHIPSGAKVVITEKLHGTSHRVGNVEVPVTLTRWKRFINWIARKSYYPTSKYEIVHGTRRTVVDLNKSGYYGSNQFRIDCVGNPDLSPNEMIYGEIVGRVGDTLIMPQHDATKMKDVRKRYGDKVTYDYGVESDCAFFVYRITQHNGIKEVDLPWKDVLERATELGYKVVPVLDTFEWDGNVQELVTRVKNQSENMGSYSESVLGNHISEGVVVRFEHEDRVSVFKYKSEAFRVMEGIIDAPDMEDQS